MPIQLFEFSLIILSEILLFNIHRKGSNVACATHSVAHATLYVA